MRTYYDGKYVYSVDMMIAYMNLNKSKLKVRNIPIEDNLISRAMNTSAWGEPDKVCMKPITVLENASKCKKQYDQIMRSNLNYPIIMNMKGDVMDGFHRVSKSLALRRKTVKAIILPDNVVKKCILGSKKNWRKIDDMEIFSLIEKFVKSF